MLDGGSQILDRHGGQRRLSRGVTQVARGAGEEADRKPVTVTVTILTRPRSILVAHSRAPLLAPRRASVDLSISQTFNPRPDA